MTVLLVSTWETACGIAETAALLKEAVEAADPAIAITPSAGLLDPGATWPFIPDVLHLNYQAALHSRWQAETIQRAKALGCKVLVTYHDSGVPNSEQCQAVCGAADYFVLHEPYDDLPVHGEYLRMGVQDWVTRIPYESHPGWAKGRPILGTVGFPFPWKNYDELARVTAQCGWAFMILAPNATDEDVARWLALNPWCGIERTFKSRVEVVSRLSACDATAFTYTCANTGQSGAILQGIAARKPVIALSTCRQMRALYADPLGREAIRWVETFDDVARYLQHMNIARVDPAIVALAEQESWAKVGARYATIYRELAP